MFCTQCGKSTANGTKFCAHCGASSSAVTQTSQVTATSASPSSIHATPVVAQVRPWVRYWARMFDIYLAAILGGIVIGIFNPDAFNEKGSDQLFGLVVVFAWVFIESLLLSTIGTTPGKWLLKTRIIPPSGETPSFSAALSRSFKVWLRGLGIGFPIATVITCIVAHGKLTKSGSTTWDSEDGFTVVHGRIGSLRAIVAVTFFIGFLLLVIVGSKGNL